MRCPRCGALARWQREGFVEGHQVIISVCTQCDWEEGDEDAPHPLTNKAASEAKP